MLAVAQILIHSPLRLCSSTENPYAELDPHADSISYTYLLSSALPIHATCRLKNIEGTIWALRGSSDLVHSELVLHPILAVCENLHDSLLQSS